MQKSFLQILVIRFVKKLQKTFCKNIKNSRRRSQMCVENLSGNPFRPNQKPGLVTGRKKFENSKIQSL